MGTPNPKPVRMWDMCSSGDTMKQAELLNDGWEPFAVVLSPTSYTPIVYFRRIEPITPDPTPEGESND